MGRAQEVLTAMYKEYSNDDLAPISLMAGLLVKDIITDETTVEDLIGAYATFMWERERDVVLQINKGEGWIRDLADDGIDYEFKNIKDILGIL